MKRRNKLLRTIKVNCVPTPSAEQVKYYLKRWDSLTDYVVQESAIDELFKKLYKTNTNLKQIIIKCSILNDFYSTNIFKVFPVAQHILDMNIDILLRNKDITVVDKIRNVTIEGKNWNFYSFATKYCSHHDDEAFPIYDSYIDIVLRYFREKDKFFDFINSDLKEYKKFKNILIKFREFYKLNKFTLKQIDKYLWQLGKDFFPKKY